MDLEGLFNLGIMSNHEADVTSNAASIEFKESAEAEASLALMISSNKSVYLLLSSHA